MRIQCVSRWSIPAFLLLFLAFSLQDTAVIVNQRVTFRKPLISTRVAARAERIIIEGPSPGFPLVFELREGRWLLVFDETMLYPASGDRIKALLAAVSSRRSMRKLNDADSFNYGTNGAGSCALSVTMPTLLGHKEECVAFGAASANGSKRYIRRNGSDSIEEISTDGDWIIDNRTATWIERRPFATLCDQGIARATLYAPSVTMVIERADGIRGITSIISGIQVKDITNIPANPSFSMRIERGDGTHEIIAVSAINERECVLRAEGDNLSWIVESAEASKLLTAFQQFSAM